MVPWRGGLCHKHAVRLLAFFILAFFSSFAAGRSLFAPRFGLSAQSVVTRSATNPAGLVTPPEPDKPGSSASGDSSVHQSIRDALAGDDPFASAARVLAWLETTTVETFRVLAEDPTKFPSPYFSGFDQEFRSAYFEAIAERWMALDPEGAPSAMQRVDKALEKRHYDTELLTAAGKLRPELVLKTLPLENKGGYLEAHTRVALGSLAARDIKAARQFAEHWSNSKLREQAYGAIAIGVARNDPLAVVAMAREMKQKDLCAVALQAAEKIGPGMIRQVLQAAGDQFEPYAISPDFVLRHPDLATELPDLPTPKNGVYLNEQMLAAADGVAREDRERLLTNCKSLPASARDAVVAALASAWARNEPQKAAEWAFAYGKAEDGADPSNNPAQQVFLRWINNDADAALGWWRALPQSPLRDALGTNGSTYLAEEGHIDVALEMFHPLASSGEETRSESEFPGGIHLKVTRGGTTEEAATAQLAQILIARDPKFAADWFATLPTGIVTDQTARAMVSAWYDRDPEEVARWIERLPPGRNRDQTAQVFIEQAVQQSPAGAAEWVGTIDDAALRQKAALWVFWAMQRENPATARQWLKTLDGVDREWRERILRRWR